MFHSQRESTRNELPRYVLSWVVGVRCGRSKKEQEAVQVHSFQNQKNLKGSKPIVGDSALLNYFITYVSTKKDACKKKQKFIQPSKLLHQKRFNFFDTIERMKDPLIAFHGVLPAVDGTFPLTKGQPSGPQLSVSSIMCLWVRSAPLQA